MTVYGLSDCETISYRNCIRHTPCAAVFRRHTECAGYIGIRHFIASQRLTRASTRQSAGIARKSRPK
jgi:hypothetical protein